MKITLPDFVTDVSLSDDNCELKVFKWCSETQTIDIFAALGLTKNDDGGFDVRLKDQICTFSPATLAVNPDNPNEFIFNNQFGQTTVITVPSVALDMDGATLSGSVLQLTFGGDGNPGSLNVDICEVVANNCNATLTVNADGSLTHVDNAGVVTNVPAPPNATADSNITDNGDGTATVTQSDSTTCDVQKPLTNWAGDRLDEDSRVVDRNVVEDVICEDDVVKVIRCDGTETKFRNVQEYLRRAWAASTLSPVDETVSDGTVVATDICLTINGGCCGKEANIRIYSSYTIASVSDDSEGSLNFRPELSCDGGATWSPVQTGGGDEIRAFDLVDIGGIGEFSFIDFAFKDNDDIPPDVDTTICARLIVNQNNIAAGQITVQPRSGEFTMIVDSMEHCD
jgi:hypothetical protein